MRGVKRRIEQLEHRTGISGQALRLVVTQAGVRLALDMDRCSAILDECGYVQPGPGIAVVDLMDVPDGLSAAELETYLREHGEEIFYPKSRANRYEGRAEVPALQLSLQSRSPADVASFTTRDVIDSERLP